MTSQTTPKHASTGGTEPRIELKLTTEAREVHRVHAWLRVHPDGFAVRYPPRRVNSVYFDTPDLASYHNNLAGVPARWKLRWRWYGQDLAHAQGTLEIKRKHGLLGWKPQYQLAQAVHLEDMTWPQVLRALRGQLPQAWWVFLEQACCPVILSSYARAYYESADRVVRATVDTDQAVYDQRRSIRPNVLWASPLTTRVVLELKAAAADHDRLASVAAAFPIRTDRHSKYVSAVQAACAC